MDKHTLYEKRLEKAEGLLAEMNFPLPVKDRDNFEQDGGTRFDCKVFLEREERQASQLASFTVVFEDNSAQVVEHYANVDGEIILADDPVSSSHPRYTY